MVATVMVDSAMGAVDTAEDSTITIFVIPALILVLEGMADTDRIKISMLNFIFV